MVELLLGLMFSCLLLGFPMMLGMIIGPIIVLILYFPELNPAMLGQQIISGVSSYVLLAIPMYILAADLMCAGHTAKRLIDFVQSFFGHIRGGLAITTEMACTMFGAISGSTMATLVAIGRPMRPPLLESGYKDSHAIAMIMSAATIALLIPPSIIMIMYAVVTGTSVAELFLAGFVPGIFMFLILALYDFTYATIFKTPIKEKFSWKQRWEACQRALLTLGLPVVVLGGIYTGIFSPTEAAAVAVFYALILETVIYKSITWKQIPEIAYSTGLVTATVFVLVAAGQIFSWVITFANIPATLTEGILGTDPSALLVLGTISAFFFIACMFVDSIPVVLILVPIFYPVAMKAGIDPIHLGIIVTLQSAVGAVTPPFGCNIFTAAAIYNVPFDRVIKGVTPYMALFILIAAAITLIPEISLWYKFIGLGIGR